MHTQVEPAKRPSFLLVHSGLLQRKCACGGMPGIDGECAECRRKRLSAQRSPLNEAQLELSATPPVVHEVLQTPGQPLDRTTQDSMEAHFGHDFSRVRVHDDVRASASAQTVNAQAYTVGRNIVFGAGRYAPGTTAGKRLLAHELTHVVQQCGESRILQRQAGRAPQPPNGTELLSGVIAKVSAAMQALEEKRGDPGSEPGRAAQYDHQIQALSIALVQLMELQASGSNEQKARIAQQFNSLLAQRGALQELTAPATVQRKPNYPVSFDHSLEREADTVAEQVATGPGIRTKASRHPLRKVNGVRNIQRQGGPAEAVIAIEVAAGPPGWLLLAAEVVVAAAVVAGATYLASRRGWNCTASCNVEGTAPHCTGRVTGAGSGPSEYLACLAAKRSATQKAPLGCYARHCQCACTH